MSALLEVKHLTKKYKRFQLDDVSFSIEHGKICGFVGINGAGKSTTIKLISNLIMPDGGQILFDGEELKKAALFERIGIVPDSCKMYGMYTIRQARGFVSGLFKQWDEDEYDKYRELFQLDDKKKINELSKGMKMQFSLALALSHHAELLIMDEPTSGLDPYVRNQVLQILEEFVSDGKKSVLFSTHITSDLEKAADQIVFIHGGKKIFDEEVRCLPNMYREKFDKEWNSLDDLILDYIEELSQQR